MSMLSLDEAQRRLLALAPPTSVEEIPVEKALGRVLAKDLMARRTQPAADLSAMDGYAVAGDGPWKRVGESRAGAPFTTRLQPSECVRISTGAHMPAGATCVLIQENSRVERDTITATQVASPGAHVRRRGFDFDDGQCVMEAGKVIGPAGIALALAAGHANVPVASPPRVAILDCGDELAADPQACSPDQVPATNGAMVAAMLQPLVGASDRLGPVPDDRAALAKALAQTEHADILITSGGASVGDHDLVQQALIDWGAKLKFWKVAIKPGKPLMVATRDSERGRQVILGLPGNPVSSFVTAFLFALPMVRAAMGAASPLPRPRLMKAGESLPASTARREFVRGVSNGTSVIAAGSQDSSANRALAAADCLIDRAAGAPAVREGEVVEVYCIHNG